MKEGKVKKHLLCKRGKFLDSTKMPLDSIMKNAAEKYFETYGHNPDIVTYLNLHSINRTCEHIDTSLETLKVTESDTNVSVTEIRDPVFSYKNEGLNLINPGRFRSLSFDDERLYMFNGSHISSWWDSFVVNGMFGKKITFIEMTNNDSIKILQIMRKARMSAKYIFRLDDSSHFQDSSKWNLLEEIFDKHSINCLVAVTPISKDPTINFDKK